jgi:hypothetical protein
MASKIKVDQIQTGDGTGTIALQNQLSGMTTASLPALGSAQMPTGSVLQAQSAAIRVAGSSTSTSYVEMSSSFRPTITPSSTSSKIHYTFNTCVNGDVDNDSQNGVSGMIKIDAYIGGSLTTTLYDEGGLFDAGGHTRIRTVTASGVFSPNTTSQIEFRVSAKITASTSNRSMHFMQGAKNSAQLLEVKG